ncbi:MAG: GNAT family N-acetyltransferase [Pseudomonadota bacterium]
MRIRPYAAADLHALHAINGASTPGVSEETEHSLAACFDAGECWVAETPDGAPAGFLSLIETGAAGYPSPNFAWFEARGADFIYVDRIALAPSVRGAGLGARLYAHALKRWAGRRRVICCEVNTTPPNPGSMRFHHRLGFQRVGDAAHDPGRYEVAFLERAL